MTSDPFADRGKQIPRANRVAFLGIGRMGAQMAIRVAEAGFEVTAWNRTAQRLDMLHHPRITLGKSVAETCAGAGIAITMVSDEDAVASVLFGLGAVDGLPARALVIDMSSISPLGARKHHARLKATGHDLLDAPVSGGVTGAANGTLTIMVGGESDAFSRAIPVLRAMGTPHYVGPPGSGQLAKCVNQSLVGVTIGAVAEGLVLAAAAGADVRAVHRALLGGFADSRVLREHGQRMLDRRFEPGGTLAMQVKDLNAALQVAGAVGLELPLAGCANELFRAAASHVGAEADHSALILEFERRNDFPNAGSAETSPHP